MLNNTVRRVQYILAVSHGAGDGTGPKRDSACRICRNGRHACHDQGRKREKASTACYSVQCAADKRGDHKHDSLHHHSPTPMFRHAVTRCSQVAGNSGGRGAQGARHPSPCTLNVYASLYYFRGWLKKQGSDDQIPHITEAQNTVSLPPLATPPVVGSAFPSHPRLLRYFYPFANCTPSKPALEWNGIAGSERIGDCYDCPQPCYGRECVIHRSR